MEQNPKTKGLLVRDDRLKHLSVIFILNHINNNSLIMQKIYLNLIR